MIGARIAVPALTLLLAAGAGFAQEAQRPALHTNEAYVEEATRATSVAVDDPMAVLDYILGSLPGEVRVYPTENHYYFSFVHNGVPYAGNIKLDARLRADGQAMFTYYEDRGAGGGDAPARETLLDAARGVKIEKLAELRYRVSYGAHSVVFLLNDLSQVRPPAGLLRPDEQFLGPIFDESAVRFFLVFNTRLKLFLYLLDETAPLPDALAPLAGSDRILIGKRTGFAFYRDQHLARKILIGVFEPNVLANNFFDGPADQMPDNFLQGDSFRDAIIAFEPELKGKIDRHGALANGARYAITPYMFYRRPSELAIFQRCAMSRAIPAAFYYGCFAMAPGENSGAKARPLAMQRRRN